MISFVKLLALQQRTCCLQSEYLISTWLSRRREPHEATKDENNYVEHQPIYCDCKQFRENPDLPLDASIKSVMDDAWPQILLGAVFSFPGKNYFSK
jgi:hypothetical protein